MKVYTSKPFWHDDVDLTQLTENLESLPENTEVIVIGGGLTGLSASITLAQAGKQVLLVDANEIGSGASSRNGGLLGPSFHKLGLNGLKKKFGDEVANEVMRESIRGFNWLLDFIETEKIDCQLNRCGRFRGALKENHFKSLCKQAEEIAQTFDYPITIVPRHKQNTEVGSKKYHGGIVYHADATLNPARLVKEMLNRAKSSGVNCISHAKVTGIKNTFAGMDIKIGKHIIKAQAVLVATNGYTDNVFPDFKRRILPIRSSMIATEILPASQIRKISPNLRSHGGTDRLVFYYRPSPDGRRMLFGGRALDYKDRPQEYTSFLRKNMTDLFPQLADVKVNYAWSGFVAYTFDHVPHLGLHKGLHYSMGYCGSGVARASYLGNKIAHKMLGTGGETVFDSFPFESRLLYSGNPWFLPLLFRWHSFADKMGW